MSASEKTPLGASKPEKTTANKSVMRGYYCLESGITLYHGREAVTLADYDAERLSTIGVFTQMTGSVLMQPVLWMEQSIVGALFVVPTALWVLFTPQNFMKWVSAHSSHLESFTSIMATLAAFLLSFYTSLSVARWWRLRTEGVGSIWSASSQLCLLVSQHATRDEEVLSAFRRYARASLCIVFLKRRYGAAELPKQLHKLVDWEILTDDEVEKLKAYNNNLSESIWTWNCNIVTKLYEQGLIKSEYMYTYILERAMMGRGGAATIGAQLATPIPFQYVHLLGLLVKLHNICLAMLMSSLMAHAILEGHLIYATQIAGKVFLVPFLYNAILLIDEQLADPFSGDVSDFPMMKYEKGIESDGVSYVEAGANLPDWLIKKDFKQAR